MKKLIAMAVVALAVAAPVAGQANDVDNPNQCNARGDGAHVRTNATTTDPASPNFDRGSGCVIVGGVTVVYVGGELMGEQPGNGGTPCGAVVVADQEVSPDGEMDFSHATCG